MNKVSRELEAIERLLRKYGDLVRAEWIEESRALLGTDQARFWTEVNSLGWWGGSGSMADLYLYAPDHVVPDNEQKEDNRRFRAALVVIYEGMVKAGQENKRGEMWVAVFKEWQEQGI